MRQFSDLIDYTFQTKNGNEVTISADNLDSAENQAPLNSELIKVNGESFSGLTSITMILL